MVHLGLASERALAQSGHAHDRRTRHSCLEETRLGASREAGSRDADIGAAEVHLGAQASIVGRVADLGAEPHAERFSVRDVNHESGFGEEGSGEFTGPVEEVVHDHQATWREVFAQRPHRAERNQVRDARLFHRPDVRLVGDVARSELVPLAVARQEDHLGASDLADHQVAARTAEG